MGLRQRVMDMRQKHATFCRAGRHWSLAANQLAPRRSSVSESVAWNTWNGEAQFGRSFWFPTTSWDFDLRFRRYCVSYMNLIYVELCSQVVYGTCELSKPGCQIARNYVGADHLGTQQSQTSLPLDSTLPSSHSPGPRIPCPV